MSDKRRASILESIETLQQLNVEMRFKVPHYVNMLLECLRLGEYAIAAKILHMLPPASVAGAIKAFCEAR